MTNVNGTLYIVDDGGNALWSCAPDAPASATLIGRFPGGGSGLNFTRGVANDSGTLYILDAARDELWSCAPDDPASATLLGSFPSGVLSLNTPGGLTTLPAPSRSFTRQITNALPIRNVELVSEAGASFDGWQRVDDFSVLVELSGRGEAYSVVVRLTLELQQTFTAEEYTADASAAAYGIRPMDLEPWYVQADFPNARRWIDYRGSPIRLAILDLPLWQADEAKSMDIGRLLPGSTVVVDLVGANSLSINGRMLVVGCELMNDFQAMPINRVYCVETVALTSTTWRWTDTWDDPKPWGP